MADYIYLLQTKLNAAQQQALATVRDVAKEHGMTVFLVGGAVRDLTSGAPVRDLDVALQGSALSLKKQISSVARVIGESKQLDAMYLNFPGGVRMELGSALTASYPKPGKPVFEHSSILEDLRRRDFTANAMAISLNEGSYGLLMDPLNGVADIENLELRLVSNYGFIEEPVRMIRAARLMARLGWHLEEKTQQRYDTGKEEGYISTLSAFHQGYETEEIFHEEDPLGVLRHLEAEGWSNHLFPALTSAKVSEVELNRLRDIVGQLDLAGIQPDPSSAYFPILTAKLAPKDLQALTQTFVRPGFVEQANTLEAETKAFSTQFTSKLAAAPSDAWKMIRATPPEQVLSLAYSSKSVPIQAKFKAFFTEWPQARNRIPYQLMQEMRITPDLPGYAELLEILFFAIMDGKLDTPEAAKAFLEPYSPPAPPPPVNLRRRPVKRESKATKSRKKDKVEKKDAQAEEQETSVQEPTAPAPTQVSAEQSVAAEAGKLKKNPKVAAEKESKKPAPKAVPGPASARPKPMQSKKQSVHAKKPQKAAKPSNASAKSVPAKKSVATKKAASAKKTLHKSPVKKQPTKKAPSKTTAKTKAVAKKAPVKALKGKRR